MYTLRKKCCQPLSKPYRSQMSRPREAGYTSTRYLNQTSPETSRDQWDRGNLDQRTRRLIYSSNLTLAQSTAREFSVLGKAATRWGGKALLQTRRCCIHAPLRFRAPSLCVFVLRSEEFEVNFLSFLLRRASADSSVTHASLAAPRSSSLPMVSIR